MAKENWKEQYEAEVRSHQQTRTMNSLDRHKMQHRIVVLVDLIEKLMDPNRTVR
jgi:hypothetical protein